MALLQVVRCGTADPVFFFFFLVVRGRVSLWYDDRCLCCIVVMCRGPAVRKVVFLVNFLDNAVHVPLSVTINSIVFDDGFKALGYLGYVAVLNVIIP